MIVQSIKLLQFRKFDDFYAQDFNERLNVIVGKNAQGKTTILEAISILTQLKSFRASHLSELIQGEKSEASIAAEIAQPTQSSILIAFQDRKKTIKVDAKKIGSAAKYPYIGRSVSFVPDDLYLIKGGPNQRRSFFDDLAISIDPRIQASFQQFQKVLRQRNRLLKMIKSGERLDDELELWTDQYIEAALRIYAERIKALQKLQAIFPLVYQKLFEQIETVEIKYDTGYESILPSVSEMRARLQRLKEAEKAVGYTLTGPHRDDFKFIVSGLDAKSFASQGQTRSFVIALKISQLELIREVQGYAPILLLDDIVSELDDSRVHSLIQFLSRYPGQLFVSTAEQSKLKKLHEQFSGFHLIDLNQLSSASSSGDEILSSSSSKMA